MSLRTARVTLLRGARRALSSVPGFHYQELFDLSPDKTTEYVKITGNHVSEVNLGGTKFLKVEPEALRLLSARAMTDIAHLLRPAHLQQLSNILKDPEATENDRFVALELLKNANIASNFVLPGCQDTGTAIAIGKRGQFVLTDGNDESHISRGVFDTYTGTNLRYSQVAPLDMFKEANTKTNLPAQIELYASKGSDYNFLFLAKGGGSANKTYLYQQTKALLNPTSLMKFLEDNIKTMYVRLILCLYLCLCSFCDSPSLSPLHQWHFCLPPVPPGYRHWRPVRGADAQDGQDGVYQVLR